MTAHTDGDGRPLACSRWTHLDRGGAYEVVSPRVHGLLPGCVWQEGLTVAGGGEVRWWPLATFLRRFAPLGDDGEAQP